MPLQGHFVVHRLRLATINLYTKYEVSMLTHHEHMKGNKKCQNWDGWGVRVTPKVADFNLPYLYLSPP